jgi:hypothetical protein
MNCSSVSAYATRRPSGMPSASGTNSHIPWLLEKSFIDCGIVTITRSAMTNRRIADVIKIGSDMFGVNESSNGVQIGSAIVAFV